MATPTMTEQLLTQSKELVKQYIEFDINDRPSKVYTVHTSARNGTPCTVTEYIYKSPTSTLVKARKEGHGVWDSTWDADFTISE